MTALLAQTMARGTYSKVMKWYWDDNENIHKFSEKSSLVDLVDMPVATYTGSALAKLRTRTDVPLYVQDSVLEAWTNGPSISWQKFGNDSQNYWSFVSTLVVPIPTILAQTNVDATFSVSILTDVTRPYGGTYSKPEGVQIQANGFGTVYKTVIKPVQQVPLGWLQDIMVAARTQITKQTPVPTIVIRFSTECLGGASSTATVDFDTLVTFAIALASARLTVNKVT